MLNQRLSHQSTQNFMSYVSHIVCKARLLLCLLIMSFFASTAFANNQIPSHWQKDKSYHLTILHTNDLHGRFWQNGIGEYGLAAQQTLVSQIRKEVAAKGGELLLLSAGDINTGVPESDTLSAEPDFKAMDKMGYDAMTVGNHEFDHPLAITRQQQKWVSFPFLSANTYFKGTNTRLFSPYHLFNKQGIKIAVFGLTTEDTAILSSPENTNNIEFRKPLPEAKSIIQKIKKFEKPDFIIGLTHLGHYPDGKHGSMAPGDVLLARGLNKGDVAMIIGGHSHSEVCMQGDNRRIQQYEPGTPCAPDKQNGTWIMQAGSWGKYLGRADFVFLNGKLTLENYQLITINLQKEVDNGDGTKRLAYYTQKIPQDNDMLAFLTPYQERGQQKLLNIVGKLEGKLEGSRDKVRYQQTNMGQLLLSAFIEKANADIGIMTGGMIRDSMIDGNITYRDILKVEPFGNNLVYFDLSGAELIKYLQAAVNKTAGAGAYGHFRGVTIELDGDKIINVKVNNQALDDNKKYRIATLGFLASGGDGYPAMNQLTSYVDTGYRDADTVKLYFEKHSPIKADEYQPHNIIIRK